MSFSGKLNDHSVEFEKVEFRTESHSNSSMKKIGAYPERIKINSKRS
jgi:hypothetical protein